MRYGLIVTERDSIERSPDGPKHWLKRGTLIRIIRDTELGTYVTETLYPVFGVEGLFHGYRYETRTQYLDRTDFKELPECMGPYIEATAQFFRKSREFFGIA